MMKPDIRLSAFVGAHALGTAHSVFYQSHGRDDWYRERSLETTDTLVVIDPTPRASDAAARLRFFAHGHRLWRCGSGTLAAAWVLAEKKRLDTGQALHLCTDQEAVRVFKDTQGYGYESLAVPQKPLGEKTDWEAIVGAPVIDGALCGGSEDYVILEISREAELTNARPDLRHLTHHSGRALILTARQKSHYCLRYFAPQYGQPEGGATGSANIQLLRYWHERGARSPMTAHQCSSTGGEFWGHPGPETVRLCGRVEPT